METVLDEIKQVHTAHYQMLLSTLLICPLSAVTNELKSPIVCACLTMAPFSKPQELTVCHYPQTFPGLI